MDNADIFNIDIIACQYSCDRRLVDMMHGWARAESDPGKGTRVSFGFYQKQVMAEISEPRNIGREILKEQNEMCIRDRFNSMLIIRAAQRET